MSQPAPVALQRNVNQVVSLVQPSDGTVWEEGSAKIRIPLHLKFEGRPATSAVVVGDALLALNDLVRKSAPVFRTIAQLDRREKVRCSLAVQEMSPGSLSETLLVDILLGGTENARQMLANLLPLSPSTVATLVMGGMLGVGGMWAFRKLRPKGDTHPMVEAHNSIVVASAGKLNITESAFRGMFDSLKGKNAIAKAAVVALQPGNSTEAGDVRIGKDADSIVIPREATASLPNPADMETGDAQRNIPLNDVELTIVASDRDHAKTGWAAYLPNDHVCGKVRIKMEIADKVNPGDLMYRQSVRCNGELIVTVRESDNSIRPCKIVVSDIQNPATT